MKAMLFAAGLGTRLRPLTDTLPKCLVPVNDRPMIDYPLLLLRHYGIREIVVNVHHHAERVEQYLGDGSRFGVDIAYSREPVLLGYRRRTAWRQKVSGPGHLRDREQRRADRSAAG